MWPRGGYCVDVGSVAPGWMLSYAWVRGPGVDAVVDVGAWPRGGCCRRRGWVARAECCGRSEREGRLWSNGLVSRVTSLLTVKKWLLAASCGLRKLGFKRNVKLTWARARARARERERERERERDTRRELVIERKQKKKQKGGGRGREDGRKGNRVLNAQRLVVFSSVVREPQQEVYKCLAVCLWAVGESS